MGMMSCRGFILNTCFKYKVFVKAISSSSLNPPYSLENSLPALMFRLHFLVTVIEESNTCGLSHNYTKGGEKTSKFYMLM